MTHKSLTKEKNSIKQRFVKRRKLLKPFIKEYNTPVLVHAINEKNVFKKILEKGKLKLPKKHNSSKKTPYMEKYLGIDNGIYLSLGFVYLTAYGWKYNLLFDVNYLKGCKYYKNSVNYQCYKAVVDYLDKNDKEYLDKLAKKSKKAKEVIDKYYNEEYNGKKKTLFDFWKVEKEVFDLIKKYPKQRELKKVIKKTEEKFIKKFPYSMRDAKKSYLTERTPEIIGLRDINLLTNKHFLGFYVEGKIPSDLMKIMKEKYSDKIIFDGKKIKKVS